MVKIKMSDGTKGQVDKFWFEEYLQNNFEVEEIDKAVSDSLADGYENNDLFRIAIAEIWKSKFVAEDDQLELVISNLRSLKIAASGAVGVKIGVRVVPEIFVENGEFEVWIDNKLYANYIPADEAETIIDAVKYTAEKLSGKKVCA